MVKRSLLAGAAAALMMTSSACAARKPRRPALLDAGVYLASEFDAATTYHLLRNCNRCYEANPMVRPFARNPSVFITLGASALAVNYFARRLESRGHRRWGEGLRLLAIAVHVSAGAHALTLDH